MLAVLNWIRFLFLSGILMIGFVPNGRSQLVINEVLPNNSGLVADEEGNFPDCIELFNHGDETVSLRKYFLSDSRKEPFKWRFPNVKINPGEYLLVFASGEDGKKGGEIHTNFKLNSGGETVVLVDKEGVVIDFVKAQACASNISFARIKDGASQWELCKNPTPGKTNNTNNGILFSHQSGVYSKSFELSLESVNGGEIYYTLNGRLPTINDNRYDEGIALNDLKFVPDTFTYIRTGVRPVSAKKDNFKANILRAAVFKNGARVSDVFSRAYLILPDRNARYGEFEIVSVVADPSSFFDPDTGIYVAGTEKRASAVKENYNKRGRGWERDGHITIIHGIGGVVVEQDVGLRIHGATSRKSSQKSLRIYARDKYGAPKLNYFGFKNSDETRFDKLVLRNVMSCWQKTIFKDELTTWFCRNLNVDYADYTPTVVFLNGEYWGIHILRELVDEDYLAEKYDCSKDSINIVLHGASKTTTRHTRRRIICGDPTSHFELYELLEDSTVNLSDHYETVQEILDIPGIIDFYAAQLFFANRDCLENNNKLWSIGRNGKWRQILFDLDGAWEKFDTPSFEIIMSEKAHSRAPLNATLLFRRLMEVEDFKAQFLNRMSCLLKSYFSPTALLEGIDEFVNLYEPLLHEHIGRWEVPGSINQWKRKIEYLRTFARVRGKILKIDIDETLGIEFDWTSCDCESFDKATIHP